jgi:hypothetical protein
MKHDAIQEAAHADAENYPGRYQRPEPTVTHGALPRFAAVLKRKGQAK